MNKLKFLLIILFAGIGKIQGQPGSSAIAEVSVNIISPVGFRVDHADANLLPPARQMIKKSKSFTETRRWKIIEPVVIPRVKVISSDYVYSMQMNYEEINKDAMRYRVTIYFD
jgi:hypothetical protein